jgi:hypothetical protein
MFYVYLVHCVLLYSLQVDSIPKARVLCLCHKSLCNFFCQKAVLVLSSQGMLSLWPSAKTLKHVYVYLVNKRFSNWCLIIPLRWMYASRPCPLNKIARLSRSQCENAVLLLTIKPRQLTATDSQNSAPYSYWQSNLGSLLLLTNRYRFFNLWGWAVHFELLIDYLLPTNALNVNFI